MRAVVWTDAVQMVILLVGLIAVAILGSLKVGDGATVWQIAIDTGRVNFDR
jgi:Na+/proline symporter